MSTNIVSITPQNTLADAVELMDLYQVDLLLVVEEQGSLCGVLSAHDVVAVLSTASASVQSSEHAAADLQNVQFSNAQSDGEVYDRQMHALHESQSVAFPTAQQAGRASVGSHMCASVICVRESTDAAIAVRLLLMHNLKHLPVTDDNNRAVGIIRRANVCQAVFDGLLTVNS